MAKLERSITLQLLTLVLRPVASFCIRNSIRLQDVIESLKAALVAAAIKELRRKNSKKINASRVSVMTGVHRSDISRLNEGAVDNSHKDIVTKVMGLWQTDQEFLTKAGVPRILSEGSRDSDFNALVQKVSTAVNPASVLFELERVDAIERTPRGIALIKGSFVPKSDPVAAFTIVSSDMDDFIVAIDENVMGESELPNLHARTQYDNVRPQALNEIKQWLLREGHDFHLRARKFISNFDQDVNPDPTFKGEGARVVLGSFSFSEESKGKS